MPEVIDLGTGMGGSLAQSLGQGLQGGFQNVFQNLMQMQLMQMQDKYKQEQSALEYEKIMKGIEQPGSTLPNRLQQLSPANVQQYGQQQLAPQQQQQPSALTQQRSRIEQLEKALTIPGIRDETRVELRKRLVEERKIEAKAQEHIDKETKPYYDKLVAKNEDNRDIRMHLDRMEELVKNGELRGPEVARFIEGIDQIPLIGHTLSKMFSIGNTDTQEFKKLSRDFAKYAKAYFGGNMTTTEVEQFLETVPSLLQTDEGKLAVIRNLRYFSDLEDLKYKAMNDLIEANGGNRPKNLELLVDKAIKKPQKELAQNFRRGIHQTATRIRDYGIQAGDELSGLPPTARQLNKWAFAPDQRIYSGQL